MQITLLAVVTSVPAFFPKATLLEPMVLKYSAPSPMAVFWDPVVLVKSALTPMAVLETPVELVKRVNAPSAVLFAPVVLLEKRPGTIGCILVSGVGKERPGAGGRVELAFCVASERQKTDCCIESAAGEAQKRGLPLCRVASRVPAIWRRDNRLRYVEQRKEEKREENARTVALHIMARWGKK